MPRVILVLVSIAIAIYALADCASTEESRAKGLPKLVWVLLIVFVPWVGPIAWLLVGKDRSLPQPTGLKREFSQARERQAKARQARRPMAPDDDPEFLAKLEQQNRSKNRDRLIDEALRRKAEEKRAASASGATSDSDSHVETTPQDAMSTLEPKGEPVTDRRPGSEEEHTAADESTFDWDAAERDFRTGGPDSTDITPHKGPRDYTVRDYERPEDRRTGDLDGPEDDGARR